jgi:hypothetical protein
MQAIDCHDSRQAVVVACGSTFFAVAGFAAGSALPGGKSGTLRAVPLALEAAAGVTPAAFLASDFAAEVACCGALQMHQVLPGAVYDWTVLCTCPAWLTTPPAQRKSNCCSCLNVVS